MTFDVRANSAGARGGFMDHNCLLCAKLLEVVVNSEEEFVTHVAQAHADLIEQRMAESPELVAQVAAVGKALTAQGDKQNPREGYKA